MTRKITITALASLALLAASGDTMAGDLSDWGKILKNNNRFEVLNEFNGEAVLDHETQLVWQAAPLGNAYTWSQARERCRLATSGERMGWRLPSLHELSSLYRPGAGLMGAPLDLNQDVFWTATSVADDVNSSDSSYEHAYMVWHYPGYGHPNFIRNKSEKGGALCVRGTSSAVQYERLAKLPARPASFDCRACWLSVSSANEPPPRGGQYAESHSPPARRARAGQA